MSHISESAVLMENNLTQLKGINVNLLLLCCGKFCVPVCEPFCKRLGIARLHGISINLQCSKVADSISNVCYYPK